MVNEFDLLKALEEEKDLETITAEAIMTMPAITVEEDVSLREVLKCIQARTNS